ncbi:metallophosphoesterase [Paracoccus sp. T5]|uniref:metallophosphoesterase n=1 Tax=Paracoccus sp. T5 TaxID=3402161 RepID=UPI003AECCB6F
MSPFSPEILTFHAATLVIGLIVALRFVGRLPIARLPRHLLMALVLVVAVNRVFSQLLTGALDPIELPRPMIIALSWLFASVLMLAVAQVALDVVTVLRSLAARRMVRPAPWMRLTMGATVLCLSGLGVVQALRLPPVTTVEVAIRDLPAELDGYRVLQLSDLHISKLFPAGWATKVVALANDQGADLVAITGDLVDGLPDRRQDDVAPLQLLKAPDGVYMVPGNHEYYFDYDAWMAVFPTLGLRPLPNSHVVIRRGSADLVVAGVTDLAAGGYGEAQPDLSLALAGAPEGAPVLLLSHQPKLARRAARAGVDLQLSGHTHGGMAVGLSRLVARMNGGFVSGLYHLGDMQIYVSNGTGHTPGFAFRFGVPPEMTMIVLRRA